MAMATIMAPANIPQQRQSNKMAQRIIAIDEYMPIALELLAQGDSISLTVSGSSMAPFICGGRDQVRLVGITTPPVRGDIVFFKRSSGQYVMHRIVRRLPSGDYVLLGDAQQQTEAPIASEQIFAKVIQVCRKGKWIGPKSLWWRFFAGAWLMLLPLRPALLRVARFIPARLK